MPSIRIKDEDLTTAVGVINNSYAVFVPGFSSKIVKDTPAMFFDSLSSFKDTIGATAVPVGTKQEPDASYIYACELLGAGLPVVYKVIPQVGSVAVATIDSFDEFVSGTSKLSQMPAENAVPGTTNLSDSVTLYDSESSVITGVSSITVAADKTITVEGTLSGTVAAAGYTYMQSTSIVASTATVAQVCAFIATQMDFSEVKDRGQFDISFITSGGYPAVYNRGTAQAPEIQNFISKLTDLISSSDESAITAGRGDSFVLIDLPETHDKLTTNTEEAIAIRSAIAINNADAFVVDSWINWTPVYSGLVKDSEANLPGSFAFLRAFASSIRSNNSWFATAGVKRGLVSANSLLINYTNAEADALQPNDGTSVNAITYIKPYGYTIWGNRTLVTNTSGLTANSFINIRQLVHDIKRHLYKVARGLMFEQNDDILWVNFRNLVSPLLDKMQSGQGISSYRLVKQVSTRKATLTAKIVIVPIEAIENFELTVVLADEDATVTG